MTILFMSLASLLFPPLKLCCQPYWISNVKFLNEREKNNNSFFFYNWMSHKLVAKLLLWCFYFLCVSLKLGLSNNKCLYYNYLITTCTKVYNKVQELFQMRKKSSHYNFAFVNKKAFTPLEVIFVQWNLDDLKSVWLAKQKNEGF